jgi:hypothetical protein
MQDLTQKEYGQCLIPYYDLINNYTARMGHDSSLVKFSLKFDSSGVKIFLDKSFKKGEDYAYSYSFHTINNSILRKYGFYLSSNEYDVKVALPFKIRKDIFNETKYEICQNLKCLDISIDEFYKNKKLLDAEAYVIFNTDKIKENFVDFLRLQFLPNKNFSDLKNAIRIHKKLLKGRWLSYENETISLAYYRKLFYEALASYDLKLVNKNYIIILARHNIKYDRNS